MRFMDGNTNTLQNYGMVTTLNGIAGTNIVGYGRQRPREQLWNCGWVRLIWEQARMRSTTVQDGAASMAGSVIALGANEPLFECGHPGFWATPTTITRTTLTGRF